MNLKLVATLLMVNLALILLLTACSMGTSAPTATPTATNTSTPTPTATPTATTTSTPVPTPNPTATELARQSELMLAEVENYYKAGYLPSTKGIYIKLDDFSDEWAQINYYRWWEIHVSGLPSTFVLSAHFKWESAILHADRSGCGFVFAGSGPYVNAVFLDRNEVVFLGPGAYPIKRTRGTEKVSFGNPAEADFTLIANNFLKKAFVLVNGRFVGEYYLGDGALTSGYIGYSILSGTNKDFGTRCEMNNVRLWHKITN